MADRDGKPQVIHYFNIAEELKKNPSKVSLFDALKILRQIDMLRIAIIALYEGMDRVLNLFKTSKYPRMGKNNPHTFYMTLEIEGYVLHNY